MAKLHGSLARAGKVKRQTPTVTPADAPKDATGRAALREKFNRRFVANGGYDKAPNPQALGKL